jgi:hypothetical protein
MMEHKIFINPKGYIEVVYNGTISQEENRMVIEEIIKCISTLDDQGKKVKILMDNTNAKEMNPSSLDFSTLAMRDMEYDRIAGFGADDINTESIMKIILSSEVRDKVRLFKTRSEAEEWLKA